MSLKLTFSKVAVLSFSRKPESGTIKISCAPTKTVAKAMGWEDVPGWMKSGQPEGALAASIIELTPTHTDLAKHAMELTTTAVRDFDFVRTQVKKGKTANKAPSYKTELHCTVDFSDSNGARKLEAYIQAVPESTMKVTYEKAAEQEEIDLAGDERRQALLEDAD